MSLFIPFWNSAKNGRDQFAGSADQISKEFTTSTESISIVSTNLLDYKSTAWKEPKNLNTSWVASSFSLQYLERKIRAYPDVVAHGN